MERQPKILRPSKALNQMCPFELAKRRNQLQKLISVQDEKIDLATERIGKNMARNYKKELTDEECHKANKLAYEGMILAQGLQQKIRSELELLDKHYQAIVTPIWCPKCHQNQLIPDTTVCYECNLKDCNLKDSLGSMSSLGSIETLMA